MYKVKLIDKLCKLWLRAVTLISLVYTIYQNKNANNIGPHLGRLIYKKMCGRKGQIVNQFYYREILERLRNRVVRVRPSVAKNRMPLVTWRSV